MTADGFQAPDVELFFEFLRSQVVCAGQFDGLDAKTANLVERSRHTVGELSAQTVKLEPNRAGEARADAGGMAVRRGQEIR